MRIEVHIDGECRNCWVITDDNLADIPGASKQENMEAREAIVNRYLEAFKSFVSPMFKSCAVQFYLVFESKIKYLPEITDDGTQI